MKKNWIVENLNCASCVIKIEDELKKIEDVENISLNFVSKKLTVEIKDDDNIDKLSKKIKKIVKDIEPDVRLVENDAVESEELNITKSLLIIIFTLLFFSMGLILNISDFYKLILFLFAYILIGSDIVFKAVKNLINGKVFDENFLMTIATLGAFATNNYSEAVAVMLFYKVGEFFQDLAVDRSRKNITKLMDIKAEYANLKVSDGVKQVSPEKVNVNDLIIVKPGEKVPLDGIIIEGESFMDTSAITGESVLREVNAGDQILSGFINTKGLLTIKVNKEYFESTVSKILDLVENASNKKAYTENFITKFAKYYTPIVVILAFLIAIFPPLLMHDQLLQDWVYRSLVFLVISCPCALVISIPLGFFGGIGGASKKGILIKGSNYLEMLNNIDTIVFDKTGTLTKGEFNVTEINPSGDFSKDELLKYAAFAEIHSSHPIAVSIVKRYGKDIDISKIKRYEEIPGHGVMVNIDKQNVIAGNRKLMEKEGINYDVSEIIGTVLHVAVNKEYIGYIVIADEIKEDSVETIKKLKRLGIKRTVMLTGDSKTIGGKVAKEIGIDEVFAELLPGDKVGIIESLYDKNYKIAFLGDGINDAPSLAIADVGIAMGGLGSDAAIEASDIVIMTDEPSKLITAIKIAKKTRRIVWQNIYFAIGIKIIFLTFGALGVSTMWEAVFADVGVSLIAILNAMRVMKVNKL